MKKYTIVPRYEIVYFFNFFIMKKEASIKIYWVTTVWAKGQVILTKEVRDDFSINKWDSLSIVTIDDAAIWLSNMTDKEQKKKIKEKCNFNIKIKWWVKIWTKFQFVIPSSIRENLKVKTWDSYVIVWKLGEWIWLLKNDRTDVLFKFIWDFLNEQK